jgi:hypothetical protein
VSESGAQGELEMISAGMYSAHLSTYFFLSVRPAVEEGMETR